MPRTKEFDPDVVLDAAMRLFWRQGYATTSMADLTEHLGIARASLYATFGNKHDLYLKALDRYAAGGASIDFDELLAVPGSPLAAVERLLEAVAAVPTAGGPLGCLVANATVETGPEDTAVRQRLEATRARMETALVGALLRARALGEISAQADPRVLARYLLVLVTGMLVLGRAGEDQSARLRAAVEGAMATLR